MRRDLAFGVVGEWPQTCLSICVCGPRDERAEGEGEGEREGGGEWYARKPRFVQKELEADRKMKRWEGFLLAWLHASG